MIKNQPETYYYGQGEVLLARRDANGQPETWYWVGDVSALSLAINVQSFNHLESYSGNKTPVRRINTAKDGTVTSTWHEFGSRNLAILLYGEAAVIPAGTVTGETLPSAITAGQMFGLKFQQVSDVVIGTLVEGTDYELDPAFGMIKFLTAQPTAPSVNYSYAESFNTTIFTDQPPELAFRYQGINLAEDGANVLVELHRIKFDPASAIELINNANNLAGMQTTAGLLFDSSKGKDPLLGQVGRFVHIGEPV